MKRLMILSPLLFMLTIVWAQEKIDDFRGIEWGTARNAIEFEENLIPKGDSKNSSYYERDGEDLTIGTALLENIFYVFDEQDRFYKVILSGESDYNEDMEYILLERLGKPDKRFRKNTKYVRIWEVGDVDVILSEQRSKDFMLQIQSDALVENYERINQNINDF